MVFTRRFGLFPALYTVINNSTCNKIEIIRNRYKLNTRTESMKNQTFRRVRHFFWTSRENLQSDLLTNLLISDTMKVRIQCAPGRLGMGECLGLVFSRGYCRRTNDRRVEERLLR